MPFKITHIPQEAQVEMPMPKKEQPLPIQPKQKESSLLQTAARIPARIAETALGLPGDILQTVGDVAVGIGRRLDPQGIGKYTPDFFSPLPTSARLREGTKALTGEALEPQNTKEAAVDEFISDVTALTVPGLVGKGKLIGKLGTSAKKAFGIASVGNLASFLSQEVGVSEPTADKIKLGTMFLTSVGMEGGLNRAVKNSYKKADSVPEGVLIPASEGFNKLAALDRKLVARAFPDKDKVRSIVDSALNSFDKGGIDFHKAWALSKDANAWYPKLGNIARSELRKATDIIQKDIIQAAPKLVKDVAVKPLLTEAAEGIKFGNKVFHDINNASKIRTWLNDNLSLGKYVGGGVIGHMLGLPTAKIGTGVALGQGAFNALEPVIRSPEIRSIYGSIVKSAAQENLPAVLRNVNKLDKELVKLGLTGEQEKEDKQSQEKPRGRFRIIR